MSSDLLARLAAAHKAKGAASDVKPLFDTTSVSESRAAPKTRQIASTDCIDANRHSVYAVVLACNKHQNPKCQGMSELVVAVTSIESNGSPVVAMSPETNNTFLIATAKDPPPGGQKIKLPRYIAPETAAIRLNGVLKLSISNGRNGPRGGDFKPEDVTIGSKAKLSGINLNYKLSKPSVDRPIPEGAVYLETESIEILSKPSFPTLENNTAINAVLRDCPGALYQAAIDADVEMGGSNSKLNEIAMKDREFLAGFLKELSEKYAGAKVGVGESFERFLIDPSDTGISITETIERLCDDDVRCIDATELFAVLSGNTNCPVFVQHAPGIITKKLMNYDGTGFGPICTLRNASFNPDGDGIDGGLAVAEMTLNARDERSEGVTTPLTKPIKFDMTVGVMARGELGSPFVPSIAAIGDSALATHMPLFTTKRLKDDFGIFDIKRLHDIALELIPHANVLFFPKIEPRNTSIFTVPIVAPDNEWGQQRHIVDVIGAIKNVGIKVSCDFVKEAIVDEDDQILKPEIELFASNHDDGAQKMQKKAPTLDTTGFVALNSGKVERSFTTLLKRLPEGHSGVEFFVVYEKVSEVHDETTTFNENQDTGSAMLKSMYPTKKMLDAFILNKTIVFAIAKSKKRSREESSSEETVAKA